MKLRRQYVINKRFQYSFLSFLIVWSLLTFGIFYCGFWILLDVLNMYAKDIPNGVETVKGIRAEMNYVLLSVIVGMILVDAIIAIYTMNKVAGPLYRFHNHLTNNTDNGKMTPLSFRKGDFFTELADAYNRLVVKINIENGSRKDVTSDPAGAGSEADDKQSNNA